MWLDPNEMSAWAYWYCRDMEDRSSIRKYIIQSYWAYRYCVDVKDDPEIKKI